MDIFQGNVISAFALSLSDRINGAVCGATGLSVSACGAIVTIGSVPNSTIVQLRRILDLDHSTVVRLVDRLQDMDLVVRKRGIAVCGDRRTVRIALTAAGERDYVRILEIRRQILSDLTNRLTTGEADQFIALIKKLLPGLIDQTAERAKACRLCDPDACREEACPINQTARDNQRLGESVSPLMMLDEPVF